jgi:hypothetical protein
MNNYNFLPFSNQSTIFPVIDSQRVFRKAKKWGFPCHEVQDQSYLILPLSSMEKWQLQFHEGSWLLLVEDVPQIFLISAQALRFLSRHREIPLAV